MSQGTDSQSTGPDNQQALDFISLSLKMQLYRIVH